MYRQECKFQELAEGKQFEMPADKIYQGVKLFS